MFVFPTINNTNCTESVKELFEKVHFSPKGSSEVLKEEATYMLFLDFLEGCQGVTSDPSQGIWLT